MIVLQIIMIPGVVSLMLIAIIVIGSTVDKQPGTQPRVINLIKDNRC